MILSIKQSAANPPCANQILPYRLFPELIQGGSFSSCFDKSSTDHRFFDRADEILHKMFSRLIIDFEERKVRVEILELDQEQSAVLCSAGVHPLDTSFDRVPLDKPLCEGDIVLGIRIRFQLPAFSFSRSFLQYLILTHKIKAIHKAVMKAIESLRRLVAFWCIAHSELMPRSVGATTEVSCSMLHLFCLKMRSPSLKISGYTPMVTKITTQ